MSLQLLKEHGIELPKRVLYFIHNPPAFLVDEKSGLSVSDLVAYGYFLRDQIEDIRSITREEKLSVQKNLNWVSRSIIRIYQRCMVYKGDEEGQRFANLGSEQASVFVLHIMVPVMYRYFQLISGGPIDVTNQDTRNFLALYAPSKETNEELRNLIFKHLFKAYIPERRVYDFFIEKANNLRVKLLFMSSEEKWNLLCYMTLECARKFNTNTVVAFWYYMVGGPKKFSGTYKRMMKNFIAKQSGSFAQHPLADESNWEIPDEDIIDLEDMIVSYREEDFGVGWFCGDTVSDKYKETFGPLTQLQRQIIVMHKHENHKMQYIARELGITRKECIYQFDKAKEHIAKSLGL